MAKNKETEKLYKEEGLRRIKLRKKKRLANWLDNAKYKIGSGMYEHLVEQGQISTCELGSSRCDLYGCSGDC